MFNVILAGVILCVIFGVTGFPGVRGLQVVGFPGVLGCAMSPGNGFSWRAGFYLILNVTNFPDM